jgi:sarcosine oxidase
MPSYDTLVIGLGGMGSAALYHLARRGRRVLGLDQFAPPHDRGSSHGGSRIIRLAYYEHPSYVPLLRRAYELWGALESETGRPLLQVTGSIDVSTDADEIFPRSLESCELHGVPHEVLDAAEISGRFPGYRFPREYFALYQPDGGILDPEECVAAHLTAAHAAGADIRLNEAVTALEVHGGGISVRTAHGEHTAERVVVTAGPWTGELLPDLAALAVPERQVVGWFTPLDGGAFAPERFPVFNVQVEEGRYYGFPADASGVKVGRYHHRGEVVDPTTYNRDTDADDEALLRRYVSRYLPRANGALARAQTCLFTNSPDEHFIIDLVGATPGLVVAAGFSGHGFKFCSVVGEILADLAIDGRTRHDISLFALGRFANSRGLTP